jgi:hypothetical protein
VAEETRRIACIRCGDFLAPSATSAPSAGVPICAACLVDERVSADRTWVRPPWAILWLQLRPSVVTALLGLVLGAAVGPVVRIFVPLSPGAMLYASFLGALLGMFALGSLTLILLYPARLHVGHAQWRRALLESCGFQGGMDDPGVSLVHFAYRRVSLRDMRLPLEPGLLLETATGLAFFGAEGTRRAFPREEIVDAGMERLMMWPPRRALRIDRSEGEPCFFAFIDEVSLAENNRRAQSLGERLRRR